MDIICISHSEIHEGGREENKHPSALYTRIHTFIGKHGDWRVRELLVGLALSDSLKVYMKEQKEAKIRWRLVRGSVLVIHISGARLDFARAR